MPSDEERREVAAALRTGGDVSGDGDFLDAVAFSLPPLPGKSNLTTTPTDLLHQIADLIDRPTCRMRLWSDSGVFRCTACGHPFDGFQTFDGTGHWDDFKFCPNCGAEVVAR